MFLIVWPLAGFWALGFFEVSVKCTLFGFKNLRGPRAKKKSPIPLEEVTLQCREDNRDTLLTMKPSTLRKSSQKRRVPKCSASCT